MYFTVHQLYKYICVCMYREFSLTSIAVTIICTISPHSVVVDYYIRFFEPFDLSSLFPLQSKKISKQRITVGNSNNRYDQDNSNAPVQPPIVSHLPDAAQFPQFISPKPFITPIEQDSDQLLFTMRVNENLGSQSHNIIHSSSCQHNNDVEGSEE